MSKQKEPTTWVWTLFEYDNSDAYRMARSVASGVFQENNPNRAKAKATKDAEISDWGKWLPNPFGAGFIRQQTDVYTPREVKTRPRCIHFVTHLRLIPQE